MSNCNSESFFLLQACTHPKPCTRKLMNPKPGNTNLPWVRLDL